jgi:hypothetical protein
LAPIRWTIRVRPHPSDWHVARGLLAEHRRPLLEEKPHELVLGAAHEAEARQLALELKDLDCIASVDCRRLGWFRRWRLRDRLLEHEHRRGRTEPF